MIAKGFLTINHESWFNFIAKQRNHIEHNFGECYIGDAKRATGSGAFEGTSPVALKGAVFWFSSIIRRWSIWLAKVETVDETRVGVKNLPVILTLRGWSNEKEGTIATWRADLQQLVNE